MGESVASGPESPRQIFARTEMSRVLQLADQVRPTSNNHKIILALLLYIFNLHNQPFPHTLTPPIATLSKAPPCAAKTYLEILADVALEMTNPSNPENPNRVTEREVTLWTIIAIGSASSFSPWRLEMPFMGHIIVLMEDNSDQIRQTYHPNTVSVTPGSQCSAVTPENTKQLSNLDMLTAYLRGYYLYGADKAHLDSLQRWKG